LRANGGKKEKLTMMGHRTLSSCGKLFSVCIQRLKRWIALPGSNSILKKKGEKKVMGAKGKEVEQGASCLDTLVTVEEMEVSR